MRKGAFLLSLLLIFTIPWEGMVRLPGLGTGARLLGLGAAAYWLVTVALGGRLRKPILVHVVVCLFVLWNAASVLWSANPSRTFSQMLTWIQLLGLFFILWDLYTTRAAIQAGLQAYVLGAYVAIGSAINNFFAGNVFYTNYERFSPGDTNPDGFGFLVVLAIPIAWYLAVSEYRIGRLSVLLRVANYVYIPAAMLGVALSGTRTAMLAAIPGMAFGLASLARPRLAVRVTIFLFLTVSILILLPYMQNLTSFQRLGTTGTELAEGDLNQRADLWMDGMAAFADHPLLGVGGGMYRTINRLGKVAHNSFVSVLVELGLVGFLLFVSVLASCALAALKLPRWTAGFWITMLLVWTIGASTLTWENRKTTWLFLGLIVAHANLVVVREEEAALESATTRTVSMPSKPGSYPQRLPAKS